MARPAPRKMDGAVKQRVLAEAKGFERQYQAKRQQALDYGIRDNSWLDYPMLCDMVDDAKASGDYGSVRERIQNISKPDYEDMW